MGKSALFLVFLLGGCAIHTINSQIYDEQSKQLVPCHATSFTFGRTYSSIEMNACGAGGKAEQAGVDDKILTTAIQAVVQAVLVASHGVAP